MAGFLSHSPQVEELILGSTSPRRVKLLRAAGYVRFSTCAPEAEEGYDPARSAEENVLRNAAVKNEAVRRRWQGRNSLVISADTMVFLDAQPLGKPRDAQEALRMLTALQGRCHRVLTGVCVSTTDGEQRLFCDAAEVSFRPARRSELLAYIATGEPLDKAGAYGIQGLGACFVARVRGSVETVIGLPTQRLTALLSALGAPPQL